ncbi:hypothetical protein Rumeso_05001 [Rubellimicrobium mesophilum DSM 19309]|uniref:Arc-like DNA binding domain-containing protein n=1 Tax=Rubellimicrobium mesophilum DSM 19309 TaxID=442562 RepID=A0A017HBC6_9RHOB|nr:Arc family DNA-binding protein [Rubellimicrobium mesophilum]EYD71600.1 hypothetical protein Rumeso_05001 [Rubellimicrobium mesophilum DSM 19309]
MSSAAVDKFVIRLPDGLRQAIKEAAACNRRTMNAEIVFHLERIFREAPQHDAAA